MEKNGICQEVDGSVGQFDEQDRKKQILSKLTDIISESLEQEIEVSENTDLFEDLEFDSIAVFRVIVRVEEVFGIEFDDVDLLGENFSNIGDFCTLIYKQELRGQKPF